MKVVVVYSAFEDERFFTNAEILEHWEKIKDVPGVTEYEIVNVKDSSFETYDRVFSDADAVLNVWITKDNMQNAMLIRHPNLKYISTFAHGFEGFDMEYARKNNITVTNTVYGDTTIAEHALALLFGVCRQVETNKTYMINKINEDDKNFWASTATKQVELYGKTIGIVGVGNIGYHMAVVCKALGMKVLGYSAHKKTDSKYDFIEQVSLEELVKRSDIISVHCPLNDSTYHLIDRKCFEEMKQDVIIINTARGAVIDEEALCDALESGKVFGAGIDVLEEEPPKEMPRILTLPNVIGTPHLAWITRESRFRVVDIEIENFRNYLEGHPTSVIN